MADRLAALLDNFSITARVFHTGTLCGINGLNDEDDLGQLHLIRAGTVEVKHNSAPALMITEPSLLFYPRPLAHRFITDAESGADFACANLSFDGGPGNPIATALPDFVSLPLSAIPDSKSMLDVIFEEAFAQNCGRQAILDRLFEVIVIQVLRHLMEEGLTQIGMLSGMAHPRLRLALIAIHERPAHDWSLEGLAHQAGMSRSVFAKSFRDRIGITPAAYLQRWRISLVQRALKQGQPFKLVVEEVGYSSEAALSRAFKSCMGCSPRQWLKQQAP
ncbi:AraC family transcriptional regulator [Microbulbifer sp. OS29]|uniref:AraC family transcriptional regulator n=1 Tax=Microbulbifer okhotskensis TaxID=2926617 RepID=A0A9X2EW09_9GAMM|nr:AraC family transcriptional regulator [Microbulbifer okhotskensis]MCO1336498.1 AraC family transcriptional regulator [Microbulbifer okhotskensis]